MMLSAFTKLPYTQTEATNVDLLSERTAYIGDTTNTPF